MKDPRIAAIPDIHGHAKGEHKPYAEERPIPYSARMLFLWFYPRLPARLAPLPDGRRPHELLDVRGSGRGQSGPPRAQARRGGRPLRRGRDRRGRARPRGRRLRGAARGMRYSIGAEVDNDPRSRPDAQNIVDAMRPDGHDPLDPLPDDRSSRPRRRLAMAVRQSRVQVALRARSAWTEETWELYMADAARSDRKAARHRSSATSTSPPSSATGPATRRSRVTRTS